MKKLALLITSLFCTTIAFSQNEKSRELTGKEKSDVLKSIKSDSTKSLRIAGNGACKCIDSISLSRKGNKEIANEISECIHKEVMVYSMSKQMMATLFEETPASGKKTISINTNKESDAYKQDYYEIERWLRDSCASLKSAVASDNRESMYSKSSNKKAMELYAKGSDKISEEKYAEAIPFFEKALAIDPMFAFCWDNLGICYRRIGNYEKALDAYNHSLNVDPNGATPLQNIPVVYESQKKYEKAAEAYAIYLKKFPKDPEGYYGLGRSYVLMNELPKGLDNLCKAYNLYIEMESPYRADAEKMISLIFHEMKEKGMEKKFDEILEKNHINAK